MFELSDASLPGGRGFGFGGRRDCGGEEQDTHRKVLASFLFSRAMSNGSVYFVTEAKVFVWSLHGTPAALLSLLFRGFDCTMTKREE